MSLIFDVSPSRFLAFAWLLGGSLKESVSDGHAASTWFPQEPVSSFYAFATWVPSRIGFRRPRSCHVTPKKQFPACTQLPRDSTKNQFPASTQLPRDSRKKQLLASAKLPFKFIKKPVSCSLAAPTSSVENALLAALPQEGFHALDTRGRVAALPVPLELVHVLPEDVARPQRANQIVELRLVLPPVGPAAAKKKAGFLNYSNFGAKTFCDVGPAAAKKAGFSIYSNFGAKIFCDVGPAAAK